MLIRVYQSFGDFCKAIEYHEKRSTETDYLAGEGSKERVEILDLVGDCQKAIKCQNILIPIDIGG